MQRQHRFDPSCGRLCVWLVGLTLALAVPELASPQDDTGNAPLRAAFHVHSSFSTGAQSLREIAALARSRHVDVVILGDPDILSVQYGAPFLRRLLRFGRQERAVLSDYSAAAYLEEIGRVNAAFPDVVLVDGMESAPFYFWEVDALAGRWVVHNWNKHLVSVGLGRPEFYRRLPVIDSGNLGVWHWTSGLGLWPLLGLAYVWVARRRHPKWVLYPVLGVAVLALVNNFPFTVPLWDAYHGDLGAAPYQHYIDYVRERGGLVYWAHPESRSTLPPVEFLGGRVRVTSQTSPHAEDLLTTDRYTGFAALYGDRAVAVEPGGVWDQTLQQYLQGERPRPVWGVGEADYHQEDPARHLRLDDILTMVWARQRTAAAVLEALRAGRCYAVRGADSWLTLDRFTVSTQLGQGEAGATVAAGGQVRIHATVGRYDGGAETVEIRLVRGGQVVERLCGTTPFTVGRIEAALRPGEKTWYRLLAQTPSSRLVSNPIFAVAEAP